MNTLNMHEHVRVCTDLDRIKCACVSVQNTLNVHGHVQVCTDLDQIKTH